MLQMLTKPEIMVNVIKKNITFRMIYDIQQKAKNMELRHWTTKLLGKLNLFDVADVKCSMMMVNHRNPPPPLLPSNPHPDQC